MSKAYAQISITDVTDRGIQSITELYYCSDSDEEPEAPAEHVTLSADNEYKKWNLTCPIPTDTYKYYYTCSEILYTDDTRSWSNVVTNNVYNTIQQIVEDSSDNYLTKTITEYTVDKGVSWSSTMPELTPDMELGYRYTHIWSAGDPTYDPASGYYEANMINSLTTFLSTENGQTVIDGGNIKTHSITADQITASDIVGDNGTINLASGTFNYGDKLTWDGSQLNINGTLNVGTVVGTTTIGDINTQANKGVTDAAAAQSTADSAATNAAAAQTSADSAKTTATNYITIDSGGGIKVHDYNMPNDVVRIASNGIEMYKGGHKMGSFGDSVIVGEHELTTYDGAYTKMSSDGIELHKSIVENNVRCDKTVASFGSSTIELGKNSASSVIQMCQNAGKIAASTDSGNIKGIQVGTYDLWGTLLARDWSYEGDGINYTLVGLNATGDGQPAADISVLTPKSSTGTTKAKINAESIYLTGDVITSTGINCGGAITASGNLIGSGLEIPSHLKVSSPTAGKGTTLVQNSSGYYVPLSSSALKYKRDIKAIDNESLDPHKLYSIDVVQYRYKDEYIEKDDDQYDTDLIGFIADQMEEIYPVAVVHNNDGGVENWTERYMIPPMLKLIQEQHEAIELLKIRVAELESTNNK